MKCPRCQSVFNATPDAAGTVLCSTCGARLRTRAPAADAPAPRPVPAPRREMGPVLARVDAERAPAAEPRAASEPAVPDMLRQVLAEIRLLRETQERILGMLARQAGAPDAPPDEFASFFDRPEPAARAASAPAVRSGRRKSVLVIDDDDATREQAVEAFTAAEVPVRAVGEGHAAISAIAEERPDVVVLELGMGGSMGGKDVVNMIKATMEWVDIPIVLYTRVPVPSQKEARLIHGADDLVAKSPEGASALVGRVIALFRRG